MHTEDGKGRLHAAFGTIKMTIQLSFEFDKKDRHYVCLERGFVRIFAKNLLCNSINVFKAFIRFTDGPKFETKCDVRVEPNQTVTLPNVGFKVDLWTNEWSNFFNVGIEYREFQNGKKWLSPKKFVQEPNDYLVVKNAPSRNVKIFISHNNSSEDDRILATLNTLLIRSGFDSYIAERNPKLGNHLWEKIHREIGACDRIAILCTKDGSKSGDVREEIGIAIGLNKKGKIIPIVENGVTPLGSLLGMEFSNLDRNNIKESLIKTVGDIIEDFENHKM